VTRIHRTVWREVFHNPTLIALVREVRQALRGCRTVLDLGCGPNSPVRYLHTAHTLGVDGYGPALAEAQARGTHDEYAAGDVKAVRTLMAGRQFDGCVALDVIEHLSKADGWRLLEDMEQLATKRVVVFTPKGFLPQKGGHGDLQEHLSGWTPDEMRGAGYHVIGMHGPASLRGERHDLRYRPKAFWALVSLLSHFVYTRRRPQQSAAIFCVKKLDR
jgi:hypothetical protein